MPTDISKSSKEQLYDLVMENNPGKQQEAPFNKIGFDAPSFIDAEHGLAQITMFAIPDSGLNGSVVLDYGKLNLQDLLTINDDPTVYLPAGSNKADLVVAFNQLYGTALDVSDYAAIPGILPITDEGQTTSLTAKLTSFAYYGSIVVTYKLLTFPLGNFITNTDIGGLTLPIIQREQTITFTNPGTVDFDDELTLTATASSLLPVDYESLTPLVCSVDGSGEINFIKAGMCTIKATQEGNEYFYPATPVNQSFSINAVVPNDPTILGVSGGAGKITVAFSAPTFTGGADLMDYRVTVNPGGHVESGSSSPIVVEGLASNTEYVATLQAQNNAGYSAGVDSIPVFTTNELAGIIAANLTSEGVAMRVNVNLLPYNGKIWVTATTLPTTNNNLRAYDVATNSWVSGIRSGTFGAGANSLKLFQYNGDIYSLSRGTTAYRKYTPATNSTFTTVNWSACTYGSGVTSTMMEGSGTVCVDGKYVYIILQQANPILTRLDVSTNNVIKLADFNPTGMNGLSIAGNAGYMEIIGDNIYVFVNRVSSSPFEINLAYKYNLTSNTWTVLTPMPTRFIAGGVASDGVNYIYAYGGGTTTNSTTNHNRLQRYDIALDVWTEISTIGTPKSYNGVCFYNDALYSYCGQDNTSGSNTIDEFIRIE